MDKQELIQAVEKAKNQTRGEAARIVELLTGAIAEAEPAAKRVRVKPAPGKPLPIKADKELKDTIDPE